MNEMKKTKLQKDMPSELPKMAELSEVILDFSELSSIMGGKKKKDQQSVGCSAIFSGHCSGGGE